MRCFGFGVLTDQYKHSKPKPTMVKDLKKKVRRSKTIKTACMVHHLWATWRVPLPKTKHILGVCEDGVTFLLRQATSCKYVTTLYNQQFPFRQSCPGWNPSAINPSSNPSYRADPLTLNLICRLEMGDSLSPKASLCTNCTKTRMRDEEEEVGLSQDQSSPRKRSPQHVPAAQGRSDGTTAAISGRTDFAAGIGSGN